MIDNLRQAILIASLGLTAAVALPHAEEIGERTAENLPYVALAGACLYGSVKFTRSMLWYEQGGVDLNQAQSKQSFRVKTAAVTEQANYRIGDIKGMRRVEEMKRSAEWMQELAVHVDRHIEPALQPVVRREMGIRKLGDPAPAAWLAALPTAEVAGVLTAAPTALDSGYLDIDMSELDFVAESPQTSGGDELQIKGVRNGDLWRELEASNRHIWLVATTQSGKTWAEYAMLTHAFDRSEGKAQAIITDIKGGAFTEDCGIPDYYFCDDTAAMPKHAANIEKAVKALSLRRAARMKNGGTWSGGQKPSPLFLVIPELNSFVQKAKEWDLLNPPPSKQEIAAGEEARLKIATQIGLHILEVITQGLEDNVRLIVDAQTSRIEEFDFGSGVKFTGGTRNNLSMAGISRNGDYVGIRDFLSYNCRGMAGNPDADLMSYDREQPNKGIPIAATNMRGAAEIVQTPALDIKKMKRPWQPVGGKARPTSQPAQPQPEVMPQSDPISYFQANASASMSDDEIWAVWQHAGGNGNRSAQAIKQFRELLG